MIWLSLMARMSSLRDRLADRSSVSLAVHAASGNADDPMTGKGADLERVARELRRFFA